MLRPLPHRDIDTADRSPVDRVGIVVPARNEAERITEAIRAIGVAAARVVAAVDVHLMIVDHCSTDDTPRVAADALATLAEQGIATSTTVAVQGGVGTARHVGIDALTDHWDRPDRSWVLSTDADSRVRSDWIVRYLRHAAAGAVAVAGVVDLFDDADSGGFRHRWRSDYGSTLAVDGRHPHAHAANLGIRLDAYRAVGGFRDIGPADDRDLWRRLRARGIEPVADASIVVDTSGRRAGRVATGFAHALATLYPADLDDDARAATLPDGRLASSAGA